MKKVLAILLSATLILSLCACKKVTNMEPGNSANANVNSTSDNTQKNIKATVHNNQGVTEQLSAKELLDIQNGNPLKFENDYWAAEVIVTGKITKIGGEEIINGSHYNWTLKIEGGEGDWFIGDGKYNTSSVSKDFIASLNTSDTVEISGEIVGAFFGEVDISNGTISVKKK